MMRLAEETRCTAWRRLITYNQMCLRYGSVQNETLKHYKLIIKGQKGKYNFVNLQKRLNKSEGTVLLNKYLLIYNELPARVI